MIGYPEVKNQERDTDDQSKIVTVSQLLVDRKEQGSVSYRTVLFYEARPCLFPIPGEASFTLQFYGHFQLVFLAEPYGVRVFCVNDDILGAAVLLITWYFANSYGLPKTNEFRI